MSKKIAGALLGVALLAGGLEVLARAAAPGRPGAVPADLSCKLERTPGVRRIALTGDLGPDRARELAKGLAPAAEVLDLTTVPLARALDVAACYRPDLVIHGLAPRAAHAEWTCPSRALTYAVERGRELLAPSGDPLVDADVVARTRSLCELRESASTFGARVFVLVEPGSDARFGERALRSCETAGVRGAVRSGAALDDVSASLAP